MTDPEELLFDDPNFIELITEKLDLEFEIQRYLMTNGQTGEAKKQYKKNQQKLSQLTYEMYHKYYNKFNKQLNKT